MVAEMEVFGGCSARQRGKADWRWADLDTWAPHRACRVPVCPAFLQQLLQFLQLHPADVRACATLAKGFQKGIKEQVLGQELLHLCLQDRQWAVSSNESCGTMEGAQVVELLDCSPGSCTQKGTGPR